MALLIKTKVVKAIESKQLKNKGAVIAEEVKEDTFEIPAELPFAETLAGPLCEIGFDASYTHNLGNFQSCRVGVSLKVPCKPAELDTVFDYAKEWVNKRMEALTEELQG